MTNEILDARAPFLFPQLPVAIGEDGKAVWVEAEAVAADPRIAQQVLRRAEVER